MDVPTWDKGRSIIYLQLYRLHRTLARLKIATNIAIKLLVQQT